MEGEIRGPEAVGIAPRRHPQETDRHALSSGLGRALPRVRLRLWLECGKELYFGLGRVQLLLAVERLGSLRRAAASLGMSYRAAWGKLQQSERILGLKLVESRGSRHDGVELTAEGRAVAQRFQAWFAAVEAVAGDLAEQLFPFRVRTFEEPAGAEPDQELVSES